MKKIKQYGREHYKNLSDDENQKLAEDRRNITEDEKTLYYDKKL